MAKNPITPVLSVFVYGEAATSLMTGSVMSVVEVVVVVIAEADKSSERKKLFCM